MQYLGGYFALDEPDGGRDFALAQRSGTFAILQCHQECMPLGDDLLGTVLSHLLRLLRRHSPAVPVRRFSRQNHAMP